MSSKTSNTKNHNTNKLSSNSHKNTDSPRNKNSNKDSASKQTSSKNQAAGEDATSTPVMSNLSSYSLIDDDQIDDQETINVGNLIIDLESDLEHMDKKENQQANAKPTSCTNLNTASSTSLFNAKINSNSTHPSSGTKLNHNKSSKHSNNSATNIHCTTSSNSTDANNGHAVVSRSVFKTSADERGELKMRITRETMPGKKEHKIVASPNHKSPTSSSNNISSHISNCEEIYMHESISDPAQSTSSISSTKECGTSTSIGTITEPDCLGPCEPGTSVNLEGIVWQETEGGILVVNVTWRGKTYVGALLDCTKHDWAPPRLCDSPASDIDSKTNKGVRTKRIMTRSNGIGLDEKNLLQTTGKLRNGKGRRILPANDSSSCPKKMKESDKFNENTPAQAETNSSSQVGTSSISSSETSCVPVNIEGPPATHNESTSMSNISTDKTGPNSPSLIGCNEPNCSKKYRNMNGLLYHQAHAHGSENESNSRQQDSNCPLSSKDIKDKTKSSTNSDSGDTSSEANDRKSPVTIEMRHDHDTKIAPAQSKRETPSPQLGPKLSTKISNTSPNMTPFNNHESRLSSIKNVNPERRSSHTSNHDLPHTDFGHKSPGPSRHSIEPPATGSINHSTPKCGSIGSGGSSKQSNLQPPHLSNPEEGMKPSGTSTGPPPAPHQGNCYFNPAFMASSLHQYPLLFNRPMYDPIGHPGQIPSATFQRFINSMRHPPPPDSPSRLLSPSTLPKNLTFQAFKMDPGAMSGLIPPPCPPVTNSQIPVMPQLTNAPLPVGPPPPHIRMPSQGDPMLNPPPQSPYMTPPSMNPSMGLPGPHVYREHFSRG